MTSELQPHINEKHMITIENLVHRFPDSTLGLDDISLQINKGDFVIIAGQNGSGKTTLLKHLNGLLLATEGTVHVEGICVRDNLIQARQTVGMSFQDADSQIVGETVYDDVAFGPENLCLPVNEIRKRVTKALETVGLTELADKRPHLLSGGEKRKLAIAGILAMKPSILVFDEPFTSLDYPGVRQVLHQIVDLHRSGHTIIVTTHDLEKIIFHADRLILMNKGKVVKDGTPKMVLPETEKFGIRMPCQARQGKGLESWLN